MGENKLKIKQMKINVEVDLSDFFNEGESASFSEQIKDDISARIYRSIWESLNKEMVGSFENQVKRKVEVDRQLKIQETIDQLFTNKKIKKSNYSPELITVSEFIELELDRSISSSRELDERVQKLIKDRSSELINELKNRYDLLFASQIVSKMKENGFLKDDVAKFLLGE